MILAKCVTCNGVYAPLQDDGAKYYHVCSTFVDVDGKTEKVRDQARNENVKGGTAADRGDAKATGKGTITV